MLAAFTILETRTPDLRAAAARLAAHAATIAPDLRPTVWQDGLDLLAVAAGLKPVCLLGRGDSDAAWLDVARDIADALDLTMLTGACWQPIMTEPAFPSWYRAAVAERAAGQHALYLWRDPSIGARVRQLCVQGCATPQDEAALLGYPRCCVAQHHDQVHVVEQATLAGVMRLAGGDPARQRRLVVAGIVPTPRSTADWQLLEAATAIAPQAYTSVNRCIGCGADPDGPAARLGRRYRDLADALGYAMPAPAMVA